MRELTDHHDGHGLNDFITIEADEKDPEAGNASHEYTFQMGGDEVGRIQFQHGPPLGENSIHGVTEAAVLVVLIDRIESFQAGPYPCEENDRMLILLKGALEATQERVENRAKRGVLGTNTK